MAESVLEKDQQIFIIQQLAMYERPTRVQEMLKQVFEVEISLPGITYYDISNPKLPKEWKNLFNRTRSKFLKESDKIPISQKSYRLKKMQTIFENEEKQPERIQNKRFMLEVLKQAAEDSGDSYSNEQKVKLSDGKGEPLKITVEVVKSATVDQPKKDEPHNQNE